jgi:hypothetical protein
MPTISTAAGLQPLHDDRRFSPALIAVCGDLARAGDVPPRPRTAVLQPTALIPPPDPLSRLRF